MSILSVLCDFAHTYCYHVLLIDGILFYVLVENISLIGFQTLIFRSFASRNKSFTVNIEINIYLFKITKCKWSPFL